MRMRREGIAMLSCLSISTSFFIIYFSFDMKWLPSDKLQTNKVLPPHLKAALSYQLPHGVTLKRLTKIVVNETDNEWLPVLRASPIRAINWFHQGLASKYEVILNSGHMAAAKPIRPDYYFRKNYPRLKYNSLTTYQKANIRRSEWEYQGWSEIVAFHIDRVLQFHRKPPIVGRYLTNKRLYETEEGWLAWLLRTLPTYSIPVALVPWMEDLQRAIPSTKLRDILILNDTLLWTNENVRSENEAMMTAALKASDKLIFDYLVDDHDTQGTQNWKADSTGNLLFWDSGWVHGPYPRQRCFDILCGTKEWKGVGHYDPNPANCTKICRFRNSTYHRLATLYKRGKVAEELSFGALLQNSVEDDPLKPIFSRALYMVPRDDEKSKYIDVRFEDPAYYVGMNLKLEKILRYITECVTKHNANEVLIDLPWGDDDPFLKNVVV